MPELTVGQYDLVHNLFSLTIAGMAASALFFFGSRQNLAPKYRPAMLVSCVVVAIASYHYFRIWQSWHDAYALDAAAGIYAASGVPFNDAYRYADWLLTVPLLMVELVAVMGLAKDVSRGLLTRLSVAAFLMIGLGYPGEVAAAGSATAWIFFGLSMVPFVYILFVLVTELGKAVENQSDNVKGLFGTARGIVLVSWMFYPLAYIAPQVGLSGAVGEVALQSGYTIADLTAKAGFGLVIYLIARAKSENDGYYETVQTSATTEVATA